MVRGREQIRPQLPFLLEQFSVKKHFKQANANERCGEVSLETRRQRGVKHPQAILVQKADGGE